LITASPAVWAQQQLRQEER